MATVIRRPAAEQDLEEIAVHIGRTSRRAARRFLDAAERTFEALATMPGLGGPYPISRRRY